MGEPFQRLGVQVREGDACKDLLPQRISQGWEHEARRNDEKLAGRFLRDDMGDLEETGIRRSGRRMEGDYPGRP
jgi:hypothetical protein